MALQRGIRKPMSHKYKLRTTPQREVLSKIVVNSRINFKITKRKSIVPLRVEILVWEMTDRKTNRKIMFVKNKIPHPPFQSIH